MHPCRDVQTTPTPSRRLTCADVRFVEVDFPRQLRPRLVIEFSEGLSLLLEDEAAIPLGAEFVAPEGPQMGTDRSVLMATTRSPGENVSMGRGVGYPANWEMVPRTIRMEARVWGVRARSTSSSD